MENLEEEYIVISKTDIHKRIEELKNDYEERYKANDNQWCSIIAGQITALEKILYKSTPLIPIVENAIQFGKDIKSEKAVINENFGSPFVDYEDSTKETIDYISNLKLDV